MKATRVAAAATFGVLGVVYLLSNHPWVASEDAAEFQTMAKTGGLAHAAYPTFVLALEAFGHVPWSTYAFRANLLCSLCGALAAALAAWHGARLSGRWWAGAAGGIALGLSYQLWKSSTVAEVYAFTLALAACLFHLSWILARRPTTPVALVVGLLGGLGIGAHLLVVALLPVVLVALLASRRLRPIRWGIIGALLGGFALGLLPLGYAIGQHRPDHPMNYLALKRLPGPAPPAPALQQRASDVAYLLSGKQYLAPRAEARTVRGTAVRFRYALYDFVLNEFFLVGAILAGLGSWLVLMRGDLDALLLGTWAVASTVLIGYAAVLPDMAATYLVYPCWIFAVAMSVALGWIFERGRVPGVACAVLLVAAPFVRLSQPPRFGRGWIEAASRVMPERWHPFRADESWQKFAHGVFAQLPPRTILLANWTELMAFKYARHAEGLRPDIDLVLTEIPTEFDHDVPRALALGRPVYTTLPFAPASPRLQSRLAGTWSRGQLWEIQSTAADSLP